MNLKNLAMWGIIVFLTIGLYNMFKNPQSNIRGGNQIIFSEFLTSVENGEVLKVEIQGNNIKGVFSNGNSFSTYSPNDPKLIEKLSDKGGNQIFLQLIDSQFFLIPQYLHSYSWD